jgi:hypothetical protein
VVLEASEAASGEFIGVTKFSPEGARELVAAFDDARAEHAGKVYREGRTFEGASCPELRDRRARIAQAVFNSFPLAFSPQLSAISSQRSAFPRLLGADS